MSYPVEPIIIDENGLNDAILELNSAFESVEWLDTTYGVAEILTSSEGKSSTRIRGITKGRYPGIFIGTKNGTGYINVLPDSKLGNYSYIIMESDTEEHESGMRLFVGGIVVWWDYRKVYGNSTHKERNRFNIRDILKNALTSKVFKHITVRVGNIDYDPNKIYAKFDKDVIENQFLMRPYGGLRINFEMSYIKKC